MTNRTFTSVAYKISKIFCTNSVGPSSTSWHLFIIKKKTLKSLHLNRVTILTVSQCRVIYWNRSHVPFLIPPNLISCPSSTTKCMEKVKNTSFVKNKFTSTYLRRQLLNLMISYIVRRSIWLSGSWWWSWSDRRNFCR